MKTYDYCIVGGGFFGLYLAKCLGEKGKSVVVIEKEKECMTRASLNNQARVHNGYHYPRSPLTAMRSRVGLPKFTSEFPDAIESEFDKYYAISESNGKVTDKQFKHFCRTIDIPCEPAESRVKNLFHPKIVKSVYKTTEFAFNSHILKKKLIANLPLTVEIITDFHIQKIGHLNSTFVVKSNSIEIQSRGLFNCTYSNINEVNLLLGAPNIPIDHELTEICLTDGCSEIMGLGITVMCGPFFSIMPYPPKNLHSLSHVRYTPHYCWKNPDSNASPQKELLLENKESLRSAFVHMKKDAARFLPDLKSLKKRESLWEIKSILPTSAASDSRPILFKTHHGFKNYHCILGGKIDNIYDMTHILNNNFEIFDV
ncbi:FAD-dependent oxidoreductase [bacterium]|nr:FAD-dependent oxidoreductase [bacterium]